MTLSFPRSLYHPPVKHVTWVLERDYSINKMAEEIPFKIGPESTSWERILWHGGFYLNKIRLSEETIPKTFTMGTQLDVYFFLREPEPLTITSQHILQEGEGYLAANKPPWLPVQGSRTSLRFSLQEELRNLTGLQNLNAVHRLDRETSGVVVFAKDKKFEAYLMKQFHDQKVKKTYLAVVSPVPPQKNWSVAGVLVRDIRQLPQDYYRLRTDSKSKGRWSETGFELLREEGDLALLRAMPKTGRTHQIRVHLAHDGTPIIGDRVYGEKHSQAERMQLHAYEIEFPLKEGKELKSHRVCAPIPQDFLIK